MGGKSVPLIFLRFVWALLNSCSEKVKEKEGGRRGGREKVSSRTSGGALCSHFRRGTEDGRRMAKKGGNRIARMGGTACGEAAGVIFEEGNGCPEVEKGG